MRMRMFARILLRTVLTSSLLTFGVFSIAQDEASKVTFKTIEVAKGLFMLQGEGGFTGGNLALSIGEDGVVMIDDSMPPFLDTLKKSIALLSNNKPVDFLINTHVHGDHTGNNEAMGDAGAHIIAHKNMRKYMLKKGGTEGDSNNKPTPLSALPVITFSHSLTLHLNGSDAHIFHVAHAHTNGDAVIHFRDLNVIHTGDAMFNSLFPYIDLEGGGTVGGYIAAQKRIYALTDKKTKIIPGHGNLASKSDLKTSIDMLEDARSIIQALIKQGKSEEEVMAANPLKKYHDKWNWGFITTEKMTRTFYKGLSAPRKHDHGEHDHGKHKHH